jgi:DNA helicase-2/ATP-dependent DNA helicase PcrA
MRFHADLHVHSKYSRATSRDLDLEHLAYWACRKGVALVATGDFAHPAWRAELKDKLVAAEPGLYRLRPEIEAVIDARLPPACRTRARFMLEVEISTIYKKGERTRKVHHLIYAPDFATIDRISQRLAKIGNIASDGRPILGLDSRNLLEITLESGPGAYLVPAHIWTPWFAALGSMSGFDSIEECYGDLAPYIFAVETGLSSDPPMNWRLSMLDRYRLTSNSDAHSPGKIGREATLFDCDLDYFAIRRALETGGGYAGTVEFFPEEGKYHLDGHRKCGARMTPEQTDANEGRCPVCGAPVTVGVLHRVEALADRREAKPPPTAGAVASLVPLPEVLAEIAGTGPGSQTVARSYDHAVTALGPELSILEQVPIEDISAKGSSLLAEAIARLRAGKVIREAGYDGEYGTIRLFEDGELKRLAGMLFDAPPTKRSELPSRSPGEARTPGVHGRPPRRFERPAHADSGAHARAAGRNSATGGALAGLDDEQRGAAEITLGALLIVAGPGSGKTRTLTHRIAHIVERGAAPEHCLAITFTRRAAQELRERLSHLLPGAAPVAVHTFHSLGLAILREHSAAAGLPSDFRIASEEERLALLAEALAVSERKAEALLRAISRAKRTQRPPSREVAEAMAAYGRTLAACNWIDFDDLIRMAIKALTADPAVAAAYRDRFRWISVDEFQDVDEAQYRLLRLLAPDGANLCVIGDPDQAIYGFRGADASCFDRFRADYPDAKIARLTRNYRSSGTIVTAASQVIAAGEERPLAAIVRDMHEKIAIHAAPTERAEAEFVVQTIEQMIGGHSFFSIDSGRASGAGHYSFGDFAVLYRTDAQSGPLIEALERAGIPYQKSTRVAVVEEGDAPAGEAEFDPRAERVALLTLHAAKGLEFPVIFIVGLEDGILPLYWGEPDEIALAEERRLFYVGMTRARDRLVLSRALSRRRFGEAQRQEASPFLSDIVEELVKHQRSGARIKPEERQLKLL